MKYIIAIGIFQALAAATLLWRSRIRDDADGLLIALAVCISIHLSIKFIIYNFVSDTEILGMMNTFIWLCYLPILCLYTIKISRPDFIPASKWWVFIPFIVGAIGFFSVASVLATNPVAGHQVLFWYNTITLWTIIPLDAFLACWIIYFAKNNIDESNSERNLIIQLAYLFLATSFVSIILTVFQPFGHDYNYLGRSVVYTILIVICIRIISYKYYALARITKKYVVNLHEAHNQLNSVPVQSEELDYQFFDEQDNSKRILVKERDDLESFPDAPQQKKRALLQIDEMLSIVLKLENAMATEAYFKDSELTLDKLASYTKNSKYHISETLNHYLHKPFYLFVNEYRIEYVKEQMNILATKDYEINMLSLAYEAGFNSKSSFNRYFKEIAGETPSSYFKRISDIGKVVICH
ncbi:AraC family transcriptional regulator [Pedobacter sp. Leaf176]|uniref:helix-turn-helix domain-containing protein n=1 Tax=Pedobacter sp. Leaf176 TaxID=1736286 RepID=UPI0006F5A611|nr:helix-turn-helix domain-containing protein [Pedobacter sp. Leaf176]KQR67745.1 hypothetical protein ASF92_18920 [Pedobacter sp. Leaf176]